jgi:hypothetical protein
MTDGAFAQKRAYMPHCDSSILHAPGVCEYCDGYPDWQEYRQIARIAFTGTDEELGSERVGLAPCPSTWFRSPGTRDRWGGNVAKTEEVPTPKHVFEYFMGFPKGWGNRG